MSIFAPRTDLWRQFRSQACLVLRCDIRYEANAVMARPTVFLVDDDIVVLATLSKLLNHFGYTTAGASNSEAAMDYVVNAKNRFDVIVTDLAMPDVDGVALLSAAKKIFPEVPIVVVTG